MNRRTSLKSLFLLSSIGISSVSLYKCFSNAEIPNLALIDERKNCIAELADIIIPRTDTPGAKDAGVEVFIINNIRFCSDTRTQKCFMKGLDDVEKYARDRFGKEFLNCSKAERNEIVSYFEKKTIYSYAILNKINNRFFGPPFFSKLKSLTVEGYCTSMMGATQGLVYDYIPITYICCMPLTKNQKSWATK